jgi:hypothetical protein
MGEEEQPSYKEKGGPQQMTISVCHLKRQRSSNRCVIKEEGHVVMLRLLEQGMCQLSDALIGLCLQSNKTMGFKGVYAF